MSYTGILNHFIVACVGKSFENFHGLINLVFLVCMRSSDFKTTTKLS